MSRKIAKSGKGFISIFFETLNLQKNFTKFFFYFSVSDSASNADGSSIPSPWALAGAGAPVPPPSARHRTRQTVPRRLRLEDLPEEARRQLSFFMRPPPCITTLRKKVRGMRRRWRRVGEDPVVLPALLIRAESLVRKYI